VSPERQQRLLSVANFDEVIQRLLDGAITSFEIEPRGELGRVFFGLSVTEETYDTFFNSPSGYRAQYCLGASRGEKQNQKLMCALTQVCLNYSEKWSKQTFPPKRIVASLSGAGAKMWITESDLPDVDEVHINYGPWVQKAHRATTGTTADRAARANAGAGVLAPVGTQLEIKGAWVFQNCTEWLDPKKALRAEEIRDYGYT